MSLFLALAGAVSSHAASLAFAGITEGSQVVLPSPALTTNLSVTAEWSGSGAAPNVEFELEWKGLVLQRVTSSPPYEVTFANLAAGKYFLSARTGGSSSVSTSVSFDLAPASLRPANDQWSQAFVLVNAGTAATGSNVSATRELNELNHFPTAAGQSVWWSWTATADGVVTATTDGSSFDTVLAVYQGASLAALSLVGANDDAGAGTNAFSQVTFTAQAGTVYYLAVDGAVPSDGLPAAGNVRLQIVASPPPSIVITSPVNGAGYVVASSTSATNLSVALTVQDPAVISRVEHWLDGGVSVPLAGSVAPPYQWSFPNLFPGDYWLTIQAMSSNGLVSIAHAGFSVLSVAPGVELVDSLNTSPSRFQMAVTGLKGTNYTLQISSNLTAWSQLRRWTNFPGVERIADTNAPPGSTRFYRAAFP